MMPLSNITSKVSIIIPTYNRANYILETIKSVQDQTYKNWELIIVDDGSEDNTEDLVSQLRDERISFHKAGKIGVGIRLRNIGMEKASGDFIAFLDSDDLWAPGKLEKQLMAFDDYPDAAISLTGGYNFKKRNEPLGYFYKEKEGLQVGNILNSFFKSEVAAVLPTLMIKKECMKVIRHHAQVSPNSDLEFLLGLAAHFKAIVLYEPLFYRRLHDQSFSTTFWERGYVEMINIAHSYQSQKLISAQLGSHFLYKLYINYGEKHLRYKQRIKAVPKFFEAWKKKPLSIVPAKKIAKAILGFN